MTIPELIKECEKRRNDFFEPEKMDLRNTMMCSEIMDNNCFVTSEYNRDGTKRLYSVRQFSPDEDECIKTIAFQQWDCLVDAIKYAESVEK